MSRLVCRRSGSVAPAAACVLDSIEAEALQLPSRDVEPLEFSWMQASACEVAGLLSTGVARRWSAKRGLVLTVW